MLDTLPRYGRLTYTSLHGVNAAGTRISAGGWQIVQEDGGLSRDEREQLRARVATQFDAGVEIPRFPTPEQIAELPRRLVYAPVDPGAAGGATAWWHAGPAGPDATGRPGNVFTHVVLDRTPGADEPAAVRPIQLWRSPDWLAPYGADQVSRARLGDRPRPEPGTMITADSVIRFLLDPTQFRFGVLAALLDATAAALAGGPRIVLITESTDRAALWTGAVSLLMAAHQAAGFSFSTLERISSVPNAFDQGVQLACVPVVDQDQIAAAAADPRSPLRAQAPVVIIDEAEPLAIGDLDGEPHRTAAGDRITVTEWSVLAQVIFGDEAGAAWALAELDRVAARLDGAELPAAAVAWPLAMAVGRAGDRFADAVREAAAVVTRTGPNGLPADEELHRTARELIGRGLGRTTADAWQIAGNPEALARVGAQTAQLIMEAYVRRAVAEPDWLARPGAVPLPDPAPRLSMITERELIAAVGDACAAIAGAELTEADRAVAVLHLIDLLARSGLDHLEPPEPLVDALERCCHLLGVDQPAAPLIERAGPVSERALRWVIRPVLAGQEWVVRGTIGRRLAAPVAEWLYPDEGAPPPLGRLAVGDDDPLRAELAYHRWTTDPDRHPAERPLVAWSALRALAPYESPPPELERAFEGGAWPAGDLLLIRRRWPAAVGVRQWAPTVKSAPPSDDLTRLIDDLRDPLLRGLDHDRQVGADLLVLRLLARDQYWLQNRRNPPDAEVQAVISGALWAWDLPGRLAEDASDALLCALVLDAVRELGLPGAKRLRSKINSGRGFELKLDSAVLIKNLFSAERKEPWLRAALLADRGFALGGVDRTAQQWLGSLTSSRKSLLNTLVQDWAGNQIGNRWDQARRVTAERTAQRYARMDVDRRALERQADARLRAIARGQSGSSDRPGFLRGRSNGS
ncbi:GAP1-N2 domain-containing protein [Microlunatus parietis]|uniref:Uncharacterized protein n=1 Tax=Microlunatus parietis TaxID=682979 RepID=A0A7Y9I8N6_9ACTN|nr:hypothetical protein [Microlunatus parietis]NYE72053.1 hypothetical protein [Microlunatus parietis]